MQTALQEKPSAIEPLAMGAAFLTGFVQELSKMKILEETLHPEEGYDDELDLDPPCCVDWTKRW